MVNCSKCGTVVEHPLKEWKIKQTPIGLYECPSCRTKWRSKLSEASIAKPAIQEVTADIIKNIEAPKIIEKVETDAPVIEVIQTIVTNNIDSEEKPTGFLSGIKSFFSYILSDLLS